MRLLLDEMLFHTARLLRIFGVDAETIKPKNDDELIRHAAKNRQTLLTKDVDLVSRAKHYGVNALFLRSDKIEEQLIQIKQELGIKFDFPNKTRCPMCNGELLTVGKERIQKMVPENVFQNHEKFWLCERCNKAYWEGGHWENIKRLYEKISS
ncbi:Mut7-C RNAse domain protein [Candidatus Bilamarchaeum dharawalense]|uniref:Mut7-C RNAse domain protein n=1 Tax=Candidatus Bilamarchaeum dharawalense TaxID=2885759 RepID=A0A5E4LSF4_9ARCH|nr:Mut7-C RNAse domain protein [Candidatus Bilamarchaeum dharawalense]